MAEDSSGDSPIDLTILLPAYKEQEAVAGVIGEVRDAMQDWPGSWEILVVDDASGDDTARRAEAEGVRVIRRPENGGSGAARKTGIRQARGALVAMLDADGTYPASALPELLSYLPAYDQVNGARTREEGTWKVLRVPAKWAIRKLAEWVSGRRIPDLNTGMKVFKRDIMLDYLWVVPDGFSCVTSMTLAFLCSGELVKYVPIAYRKRIGESKFRPCRDALNYLATVLRIIAYFRPMRVFFPAGAVVALLAMGKGAYDIHASPLGLTDSDIILALSALMLLSAGVFADLIVAQRRGRH